MKTEPPKRSVLAQRAADRRERIDTNARDLLLGHLLATCASTRQSTVVTNGDARLGCLPLWPSEGGFLAVGWTCPGELACYSLPTLAAPWQPDARKTASVIVPPLDLAAGAWLHERLPPAPVEPSQLGARALLEGVALAARFRLDVVILYLKAGGERPEWRRLGSLSPRPDLVVASDHVFSAARSFRYERMMAIKVCDGVPAPRWNGRDYTP